MLSQNDLIDIVLECRDLTGIFSLIDDEGNYGAWLIDTEKNVLNYGEF